jgi:phosphoribosylamine--glycine ligase
MHQVLIIGNGGREHALAYFIAQSTLYPKVFIAPGNAGTSLVGTNLEIDITDFEAIKQVIIDNKISLVIPGSEQTLVSGIVDFLKADELTSHIPVIGPDAFSAQLEGSKKFSKELMLAIGIPTAGARTFSIDDLEDAKKYVVQQSLPIVLKADGLAAGKGVIIAESYEEALEALNEMLVNCQFGAASEQVLIEEFLHGIEMSYFVLCDGENYVVLPEAKDYKRIGVGDTGLNTGGMGTVSPLPFCDAGLHDRIQTDIVRPTLQAIKASGHSFVGFLFIGLMVDGGIPKVIEYNVRLGDPETQSILSRIDVDLLKVFLQCAEGRLDNSILPTKPVHACTVVLAAKGYPAGFTKGDELGEIGNEGQVHIFHAGTKNVDGKMISSGGRVLGITALANTLSEAKRLAMEKAIKISWQNKYYRSDIADDIINFVS